MVVRVEGGIGAVWVRRGYADNHDLGCTRNHPSQDSGPQLAGLTAAPAVTRHTSMT